MIFRKLTQWTRFEWTVGRLPVEPPPLPPHYAIHLAEREEKAAVWKVVNDSLALDPAWNASFTELRPHLRAQLDEVFDHGQRRDGDVACCLALTHGTRIVGVSMVSLEPAAENHLLTGPCVYSEYRNRGLGTALLLYSLCELRDAGLTRIYGVTKQCPAARFVYPKFGGQSVPYELDALLATAV
ncbi:MAG: GNAT family N-acetyltransferase [Verrucomicrobia bacterium]|nr:GNAT family N-acetyltransferase [Verrucomicrobiota bacterium]